jgi:hypothetical protein
MPRSITGILTGRPARAEAVGRAEFGTARLRARPGAKDPTWGRKTRHAILRPYRAPEAPSVSHGLRRGLLSFTPPGVENRRGSRRNRWTAIEGRGVREGGRGTIWALALRAAGASRTYRRAVPAANGWSGASGALESLDGNPYPPIRA